MIAQQKQYNVLVVGDTCTDIYHTCRNTRLNPESSAPLVQVASTSIAGGMAENVAVCLERLGINVARMVSENNSTKTRYINAKTKEQLLRVDFEDKVEPINELQLELVKSGYWNAIVLADYNKGFLPITAINDIIRSQPATFLDTKKSALSLLRKSVFLKINEHEANAADYVPDSAIVTLGAAGVQWYNERWPSLKSLSVDPCGAGDAFMAGIVYGFLTDKNNIIEHGIVNSGLAVRHIGTYAPTLEEHMKGMDEYYIQTRKSN